MSRALTVAGLTLSPALVAHQPPAVRAQLEAASKREPRAAKRRTAPTITPTVTVTAEALTLDAAGLGWVVSANAREHWGDKARRTRSERAALRVLLAPHRPPPASRWAVRFTLRGPNSPDDDNTGNACKGFRDEVASWLGTGDARKAPVAWSYDYERAPTYSVRVEVRGG